MKNGRTRRIFLKYGSILILILSFTGVARSQGKFRIDISVENLSTPAKVIMTVREAGNWVEYTAESKGRNFVLVGSVKEPSFAYLVMKYKTEADKAARVGNVNQLFIDNV